MGNRPALDILVSAGTSDQQDVGNVYGATDGESRPTSCRSRLSVYIVTGEFGIPTVYKPDVVIRELRKLFTQYQLLNRQIRMLKNNIQAIVFDNGITLSKDEKNILLSPKNGKKILKELELSHASEVSIRK